MGWAILGIFAFLVLNKHSTYGCSRSRRRCGQRSRRGMSASEAYKLQSEREDQRRRMRISQPGYGFEEDYLRQEIRNL